MHFQAGEWCAHRRRRRGAGAVGAGARGGRSVRGSRRRANRGDGICSLGVARWGDEVPVATCEMRFGVGPACEGKWGPQLFVGPTAVCRALLTTAAKTSFPLKSIKFDLYGKSPISKRNSLKLAKK
jgi:hypothetical protein